MYQHEQSFNVLHPSSGSCKKVSHTSVARYAFRPHRRAALHYQKTSLILDILEVHSLYQRCILARRSACPPRHRGDRHMTT